MAELKTIRVPKSAYETAKESKGKKETWADYLRRCADEPVVEMSESDIRQIVREEIRGNVVEKARVQ